MIQGATIAREVTLRGTGLFTGTPAAVAIRPSRSGEGISFMLGERRLRADIRNLATRPLIPAFAAIPARHTCLESPLGTVATVEHILSALAGLGITDAVIACDTVEIPILDGSALPFAEAIMEAGIQEHGANSLAGAPIAIDREIRVERNDASIVLSPRRSPGRSYTYILEYPPPIGRQVATWDGQRDTYISQVAPARTFCLEQEAVAMRSLGLFTHLTPRDMLVLGPSGPIDNTLRFPDEPARHKLLDLIGDLALVGRPLHADIVATRSGHALAHEAARRVLEATVT